ncbi:AMP-dependent synthetase and ligase [Xylanimonas cellulosilytica DSM 15894]|uniref:AMP-dependent synthetase and ligase n=1 Tax=Xylanimonas cellulosilytica (strain DSM 15894 / JCM 12276 / CECT 5975 / KCTC 9989 / LMG 20990 / NBRC 107835 / XIL07) TaxID=446471 RepID=D1BVY7_XYLCX|nr:AMP-dependent synthetase and ligase [Xylanimonas cellulosilytica DSM 15894]
MPATVSMLERQLRVALDGGPAVAPLPRLHDGDLPPGTALVVRTSGSTGTPREVALSADALRASATATHERLGGPGRWVLTLPATHVAGLQVVVRSLLAGDAGVPSPLVAAAPDARFTPAALAALLAPALDDGAPVHVSLVPTQLHRILAAADDPATGPGGTGALDALARCTSVLLGGAATPAPLLARATAAGVRVVRTYGMSETAGGCVYDGVPLAGARVRVVPQGAPTSSGDVGSGEVGVVELGGPMLAAGYVGDATATARAFRADDSPSPGSRGARWFRTSDLGVLGPDGVLSVLGRADDVVVTGGVNVAPAAIEAVLAEVLPALLGVSAVEPCVVGVPDDEWGHAVVAVVALRGASGYGTPDDVGGRSLAPLPGDLLAPVRAAVAERLGAASAPRRVYLTDTLPVRGPGKTDRREVARAAAAAHP